MAETVQGLRVEVKITGRVIGDDGAELVINENYVKQFQDGTGTDQMGAVWQDKTRPLNATSEEHNLDALTDFQGATMTALANLSLMYFRNLDEDTGDTLTIGGSASNGFDTWVGAAGDKVLLGPGGIMLIVNPVDKYAITAGTGDLLKAETADNSTYRMIIGGDNS